MQPSSAHSRVIRLLAVTKCLRARGREPVVVLGDASLDIPADRSVAVLGARGVGKTTFLHLLAGDERPNLGAVVAPQRLSPVVNAGGVLHPQLTGLENLRFVARAFGVADDWLLRAIDAFRPIDFDLAAPIKSQEPARRKALEAALVMVLPFDCYLFDDAAQLEPGLWQRCFDAATSRQAGLIFATANLRLAREFADAAIVLGDAAPHSFTDTEEAIDYLERRRG